jgi:hypothetical protein
LELLDICRHFQQYSINLMTSRHNRRWNSRTDRTHVLAYKPQTPCVCVQKQCKGASNSVVLSFCSDVNHLNLSVTTTLVLIILIGNSKIKILFICYSYVIARYKTWNHLRWYFVPWKRSLQFFMCMFLSHSQRYYTNTIILLKIKLNTSFQS